MEFDRSEQSLAEMSRHQGGDQAVAGDAVLETLLGTRTLFEAVGSLARFSRFAIASEPVFVRLAGEAFVEPFGVPEFREQERSRAVSVDPVTQTFTTVDTMSQGRFGHTATLLPNGRVLVTSGTTFVTLPTGEIDTRDLNTAELWIPRNP